MSLDIAADPIAPVLGPAEAEVRHEPPDRTLWVLLFVALGLVAISTTSRGFREQAQWAAFVYWGSLALTFIVVAVRVVAPDTSRRERITVSVAFAGAAFAARVLVYPLRFQEHDELLHLTTLRGISQSHHLFTVNQALPVSTFYPGLEIATNGLHSLTGLSSHTCGVIIIAIAKIILTLALILIIERVTGSTRAACLGTLVYAANPQYFIFNSQFSYQTLALPMGLLVVALLATADDADERRTMLVASAAILVVTVSHHLTSMGLATLLVGWWLLELRSAPTRRRRRIAIAASLSLTSVVAWLAVPGRTVTDYLGTIFRTSFLELIYQLEGKEHHQLFHDYSGTVTPQWERAMIIFSTGVICGCLLPAAWRCRHFVTRRQALGTLLLVVALAYPLVPAGHLTRATAEVTDRLAGFLFIGLALVLGYAVACWTQRHTRNGSGPDTESGRARVETRRQTTSQRRIAFVTVVVLTATVMGGTISGSGPGWNAVPGAFRVASDNRTVDALNLSAAYWAQTHLPRSSFVFSDRINRLLISSIGGQQIVTHVSGATELSPIVFDPVLSQTDVREMRTDRVDYLLLDRRQAYALPGVGVYFEQGEPDQFVHKTPIPLRALQKFDDVSGVSRIFDNGADVFYDVRSAVAQP